MDFLVDEKPRPRPYQPTLIIHGGAGAISRDNLPPELYERYRTSLTEYLTSTKELLDKGASALDAACHAVSLLEDDPLFNCGRGSVFTTSGTIEMEASVMVASVQSSGPSQGAIKRTGAVSLIRNTRHPILLAKEVLLDADEKDGLGGTSSMHCHINGLGVEKWGWREKGLERKEDDWFWTQRRWDEHRRGLKDTTGNPTIGDDTASYNSEEAPLPSQGTVGAVCFDSSGSMAVATSTGGLTNKAPGRVGDTPSVGAGFWAESWESRKPVSSNMKGTPTPTLRSRATASTATWAEAAQMYLVDTIADCLPFPKTPRHIFSHQNGPQSRSYQPINSPVEERCPQRGNASKHRPRTRRVVSMSGTGNGDSFLRVNATRTAAAMCRFSSMSLQEAVTAIAGPGGELQESTGDRWMKTGEGQGGIIGIELSEKACIDGETTQPLAQVVCDFNCGGMWRALYVTDPATGETTAEVRVFREEY